MGRNGDADGMWYLTRSTARGTCTGAVTVLEGTQMDRQALRGGRRGLGRQHHHRGELLLCQESQTWGPYAAAAQRPRLPPPSPSVACGLPTYPLRASPAHIQGVLDLEEDPRLLPPHSLASSQISLPVPLELQTSPTKTTGTLDGSHGITPIVMHSSCKV
jgi:hypothetical protein